MICGGVGAARLLSGLVQVVPGRDLAAIVNVGDDVELHGLHVSPDLDTITYTLAGAVSEERGWGLEGETWKAMEMLGRYGGDDWFSLGDQDLGTHLYRTQRLQNGDSLSVVSAAIATAWGLEFSLLPVTNDRLRTVVTTDQHGDIGFQEYFVRHAHDVAATAVRFEGAPTSQPAPGVLDWLENAERIIIAPSNPVVSVDPVLAVPGVRDLLQRRRRQVIAVSPIIGGKALKGPADRLMKELGGTASSAGVASWYQEVAGTLVLDTIDADDAAAVEALGVRPAITDTIMSTVERSSALADFILALPCSEEAAS